MRIGLTRAQSLRAAVYCTATLGAPAALVRRGGMDERSLFRACKIRPSASAAPAPQHRLAISQNVGRLWPGQAQVVWTKTLATTRILRLPAATLNTALAASSRVRDDYPCPFCGETATKKLPAQGPAGADGPQVGTGAQSKTPRPDKPSLACSTCTRKFVLKEVNNEAVMSGLQVGARIAFRIKSRYGNGMTVDALPSEHLTAMVKKTRGCWTRTPTFLARRDLTVCFRYNNVRTYGSFIREGGKPSGPPHVLREMGGA